MEPTLERAIGRVVEGTRHWSPARWSSGEPAAAMHALVQALADVCAEVEGEPKRTVPRLASDLHLPEQLQVVGLDLLDVADRLTAAQRTEIADAIGRARSALF